MPGSFQERRLVDDRLHRQPNTLDIKLAQVLPVPQHPVYDIMRDRSAALANDPVALKELHQLLHRGAGNVHLERLADQSGLFLVDDYMAVGVYFIANRERLAAILPLFCGLPHASDDLLTEVGGVILGQAFQNALQNDPLRAVRNTLPGVHQFDACPLQGHFSQGDVLTVTAEAVDLPHQDTVEAPLLRVSQHPLELVTANDALAGDVPVRIYLYDVDPIFISKLLTVCHLALDGLIRLAWPRGISRINNTTHGFPPLNVQDRSDRCLSLWTGVTVCFDQVDLSQSYGQELIGGRIRFIACRLLDFISKSQQVVHVDVEDLGQGFDHLEARLALSVLILGNGHFIQSNAVGHVLLRPATL